jgi:Cdc6-like AAA superfamily ATPase
MSDKQVPSSPESIKKYAAAAKLFTFASPINREDLLAGRKDQILKAMNAAIQVGQHAILYGERGVGKTSFAKVILAMLPTHCTQEKFESAIINCDANDHFVDIWKRIFREIPSLSKAEVDFDNLNPDDIRFALKSNLIGKVVIVIDEFDRIENPQSRILFADTIKALSDHSIDMTLILVGVADSVTDLIKDHASIGRCLFQIKLPRLSMVELRQIITHRLALIDMSINPDVVEFIAFISQGFPFFTHLIGLHITQAAIEVGSNEVTLDQLNIGINRSIEVNQHSLLQVYTLATSSARQTIYSKVLLACSLAHTDDLGFFAPVDVKKPFSIIINKTCTTSNYSRNLTDLCSSSRGEILSKVGTSRSFRYRFSNAMMQPYVLMAGLSSGDIDRNIFRRLNYK